MNQSATGLLVCLCLLFSCSRQPVGVAASPNNVSPPPTSTDVVKPDPQAQEALEQRPPSTGDLATGTGVDERLENVDPTAHRDLRGRAGAADVPAADTKVANNETAVIENQGNVGQVPLTGRAETQAAAEDAEATLITFRKSPCYGDCEVYTFDLRADGYANLDVESGPVAAGRYHRQLYDVDYDELNGDLAELRGMAFADLYPEEDEIPTDVPFREITLPDADGTPRTVRVYGDAPPALKEFMDRLEIFISEQDWERDAAPGPRD